MRINAYLARAGVASRRGADELIKKGHVTINGQPAKLSDTVGPQDKVTLNGKPVIANNLRYVLLNKPRRTVTTLKDPESRPTIMDDVKIPERVVPVGRLDFDTTGALLLTNDGQLANRLMHPSFEVDKVYEVEVEGSITPQILNKLSIGVRLEDGLTAPAKVRKLASNKIELIIHEGRNHQVKRMMEAVGLKAIRLHRSKYGPLELGNIKPGGWRDLTAAEVKSLSA